MASAACSTAGGATHKLDRRIKIRDGVTLIDPKRGMIFARRLRPCSQLFPPSIMRSRRRGVVAVSDDERAASANTASRSTPILRASSVRLSPGLVSPQARETRGSGAHSRTGALATPSKRQDSLPLSLGRSPGLICEDGAGASMRLVWAGGPAQQNLISECYPLG